MKRFLLLAAFVLALASCKDDKNVVLESNESIAASPTSASFPADGSESAVIELTVSEGTKWKVSNKPSWITANPAEGTGSANVTLTAGNSTLTSQRSGKVMFQNTAKTVSATVDVTQAAYVPPTPIEGNVVPEPAAFDGTQPMAFDEVSGVLTGTQGYDFWTWCSQGTASALDWLDDLLRSDADLAAFASVYDFGFTDAALDF